MKHKGYHLLICFFLLLFQNGMVSAQESAVENKIININNKADFQIDFTTPVNTQDFLPGTVAENYEVKPLNEYKSIIIRTNKTALPPTILKITETSGKTWNITILYKEDIDLDNELLYNFADNTINRGKNITVLRPTEEGLKKTRQDDPIPYSSAEDRAMLTKTYPDIDFSLPPPTQPFNLLEKDKINQPFIEELYKPKPGKILAFKNEAVEIEIVCQDIVFDGNNAFLKLLIQNKSAASPFLTGNMLLRLVRQNTTPLNLYPSFIHPARFPIIKPEHQISLIYAFKAYEVSTDDELKFAISDRLQKINLEFTIPGKEYNDAKKD